MQNLTSLFTISGQEDRESAKTVDPSPIRRHIKSKNKVGLALYPFFFRFDLFCAFFLHAKVCASFVRIFYVHIHTNQTVTYQTKVFRNFSVKGCSFILKYRSLRSYTRNF